VFKIEKYAWPDPGVTFVNEHLVSIGFSEPAGDLIPHADRKANFSSGGDAVDNAPPA